MLQHCRNLFLILLLSLVVSIPAQAAEGDKAEKVDPVIGRWRWFNNNVYVFHADGKVTPDDGVWKCVSPNQAPRKYVVNWKNGMFLDTLYLEKKGTVLDGKNQNGKKISAVRLND